MAYAASSVAPSTTGRFRNRIIRDLIGSISLGLGIGYYFWYGVHVPKMKEYKKYDERVREQIRREYGEWAVGPGQQRRAEIAQHEGKPAPDQTV